MSTQYEGKRSINHKFLPKPKIKSGDQFRINGGEINECCGTDDGLIWYHDGEGTYSADPQDCELVNDKIHLEKENKELKEQLINFQTMLSQAYLDLAEIKDRRDEVRESVKYYFDVLEEVRGKDWNKNPDHVLQKMLSAYEKYIPPNKTNHL